MTRSLATVCLLLCPLLARAQEVNGNWQLASISATLEFTQCIIKVEGNDKASVVAQPPVPTMTTANTVTRPALTISSFSLKDGTIKLTLSTGSTFTGTSTDGGKTFLGSYGTEMNVQRAKLFRTEKTELKQADLSVRLKISEEYTKAQQLNGRPLSLRLQATRERDADKKKELLQQAEEAGKEVEKAYALYREVIAKEPKSLAAADAAIFLITNAKNAKLEADEARKLYTIIEEQAKPFGSFSKQIMLSAANSLVRQQGLEVVAYEILDRHYQANKAEFAALPLNQQFNFHTAYLTALKANKKTGEAKEIETALNALDGRMDAEYQATVPPFKPAKYSGRKEADANQVVVLELFTGAQCPPCVAADVAFDALEKSYPHKDLVLIQYHLHIPGPDPLTNADSVARWDYYRKHYPQGGFTGTPSTVFNGKPAAGGGGGMANAENKYQQYAKLINPTLEKSTDIRMKGSASRTGDKIDIQVDVNGAETGDPLKLRLILVEDTVKYIGSNRLRFHHQVVRAMPGGAAGIDIKDKEFKHNTTVYVNEVRANLNKYLDDFQKTKQFPTDKRPLELKDLKLIALVQNDKTAEILQAVRLDVNTKVAQGR